MNNEVGKSPEMLQKEAKIKELQAILRKRKAVLKGLKTRLGNNKKEIEDIQFKTNTQMVGMMERMDELRREVAALAEKLSKIKGVPKIHQLSLKAMAKDFGNEAMFGEDFQAYQQMKQERMEGGGFSYEEEARAKIRDMFKEFRVQPDEKEQKDIRKVFVKLSNKFHPDRARNPKEAEAFHAMQQQLNEAYQSGDIHTLLELERLYLMEEIDLSEAKSFTIDVLQQAIEKLQKELQFIENQISRYQQEIKSLRDSNFGTLLTDLKRAKKSGMGFDESLADMEQNVQHFAELRDAMKESVELEKLSPKLMSLLFDASPANIFDNPNIDLPPNFDQDEAMDMLERLLSGESDILDLAAEIAEKAYEDAKFGIDDTVQIKRAIGHPVLKKVKMKNFVGRILDIGYDKNQRLEYLISLDSISMQQLPEKLIKQSIDWEHDFQDVYILEKDLDAHPPRDTEADSSATFRTLSNQYKWYFLDDDQAKRLQKILLADPYKTDEDNWKNYLQDSLSFPFDAIIRGQLEDFEIGTKVIVQGMDHFDEMMGFIMKIKVGKKRHLHPLLDLEGIDEDSAIYELLDDYFEWQDESLDEEDDMDFFF